MAYRSLPKFDPSARYIANRAFLFNGAQIQPGDAVVGVPDRRLRQLYGMRHVLMAPPAAQHREAASAARKGKR